MRGRRSIVKLICAKHTTKHRHRSPPAVTAFGNGSVPFRSPEPARNLTGRGLPFIYYLLHATYTYRVKSAIVCLCAWFRKRCSLPLKLAHTRPGAFLGARYLRWLPPLCFLPLVYLPEAVVVYVWGYTYGVMVLNSFQLWCCPLL